MAHTLVAEPDRKPQQEQIIFDGLGYYLVWISAPQIFSETGPPVPEAGNGIDYEFTHNESHIFRSNKQDLS